MRIVKKKRISFGSTMKIELYSELQKLSSTTDIPLSRLLDRAVEMLLDEQDKLPKKKSDKE